MFVGNERDNLKVLDHIFPATLVLETVDKTENCGLIWEEIEKGCYKAMTATQVLIVAKMRRGYTFDVYDNGEFAFSQNSAFDPNVEELWLTVDSQKHQDEDLLETLKMAQDLATCVARPSSSSSSSSSAAPVTKWRLYLDTMYENGEQWWKIDQFNLSYYPTWHVVSHADTPPEGDYQPNGSYTGIATVVKLGTDVYKIIGTLNPDATGIYSYDGIWCDGVHSFGRG